MAEKLTDRVQIAVAVAQTDLVHIVDVSDTSQDPAGSSFKGTAKQLINSYVSDGSEGAMTYWDSSTSKYIPISTSGIYHDASNNRIGVGINTGLSAKLHVKSASGIALQVDGSSLNGLLKVANDGLINMSSYQIEDNLTFGTFYKNTNNLNHYWNNNAFQLMILYNSGRLSIGGGGNTHDDFGLDPKLIAAKPTSSYATEESVALLYKSNTADATLNVGFNFAVKTSEIKIKPTVKLNSNDCALVLSSYDGATTSFKDSFKIKPNGVINLTNVPTSSAGLVTGDIWSNGGVLTIV